MPGRRRRAEARLALAVAALAFAGCAWGGAQQYEVLSASVRATLARAVNERALDGPPDLDARAWIRALTPAMMRRLPDEPAARAFLALVRYEALRAGLDPHLVLAVIDVESGFRKYAVSKAGARGLMQVMPFWVKELGEAGHNLFHERTNLRYGCTILRHYLDRERGNLANALGRYNGSLGQPGYPDRVRKALRERWSLEALVAGAERVASSSERRVTRPMRSYTTFPAAS
ncbi:MAG TPA: transglycosylase SLT domain-containing protein [Myxococcota bacterium]|nr:transglycosylase SLT domain-containing protein [Myxococcota bacterium]